MIKQLWAIKYRPKTIDEYIFQDEAQKEIIKKFIAEQSIPNLLLAGHRGTGKTTLALVLKNALGLSDTDLLILNASDDNSVDTIRHKVKSFVSSMSDGPFKLVLLDEADYLSQNAQATLRNLLENEDLSANARFVFTCNYPKRIMPEIRSRCQEFTFKSMDRDLMLEKAAEILQNEKVKVSSIELLEEFIDAVYPDFRKLIVMLEQNSVNGILQSPVNKDTSIEWKIEILELLNKGNWERIRNIVCENVENDEWIDVYRFLYDHIHETDKFKDEKKWKAAIVTIGDYLYRHDKVADVEINFTACIIKLTEI
jgi:DNA polymerase III delta prime subunit